MPFVVKLTCRGDSRYVHRMRTVAQFRYDDGWARAHDRHKQDLIATDENGEFFTLHVVKCGDPRCHRGRIELPPERLYPLLDWAREHGKDEVPLG